jgi:hypothetical protein
MLAPFNIPDDLAGLILVTDSLAAPADFLLYNAVKEQSAGNGRKIVISADHGVWDGRAKSVVRNCSVSGQKLIQRLDLERGENNSQLLRRTD